MPTLVQWVHVAAAVIGIGGIAFFSLVLLPSARLLAPEDRDRMMRAVAGRFRWVSWSVIALLIASGLYNVKEYYWEVAWGRSWFFLTVKIVLAFAVFGIALALTLPLQVFDRLRERRQKWLRVALGLGIAVILISAYLRRG
ncbi:MAG: hypothetical protein DMG21_17455 [Acidobacteria bacterium]|nr:MAG: hypothetical protein DMG21_17455 [Acidobacteriota bacterium]